ncbi:hypothetical protein IKW73_03545 [Candidatus Saccharibacteria bacterium]|nr:hypothetical protein [Candidatus Saccharibacteria bacterium]
MKKLAQLGLFDQEKMKRKFEDDRFGLFEFVPTAGNTWEETCKNCVLWSERFGMMSWCDHAKCRDYERVDHQNGYFKESEIQALASKSSIKKSPGSAGANCPDFGRCDKCRFFTGDTWCKFLHKFVLPFSDECKGNWTPIELEE